MIEIDGKDISVRCQELSRALSHTLTESIDMKLNGEALLAEQFALCAALQFYITKHAVLIEEGTDGALSALAFLENMAHMGRDGVRIARAGFHEIDNDSSSS